VNRFIDHLYTRLGTASNYNATANLQLLQNLVILSVCNSHYGGAPHVRKGWDTRHFEQQVSDIKNSLKIFWKVKNGKAIPVTGRGGPNGCEKSRLPHFLDDRLRDGAEVVSLTRRPPFALRKISGTHFCYRLSRPQGHSAAGKIRSIEKSNDLIGIRTCDLPACSIVPQSTTLPRAAKIFLEGKNANRGLVYITHNATAIK
jgi:hypothetical protein